MNFKLMRDPNKSFVALVAAARKEEMLTFQQHGVYVKRPISECIEQTGKRPIGIRWVDVNKGDEQEPEYRSRLVAKEIKRIERCFVRGHP